MNATVIRLSGLGLLLACTLTLAEDKKGSPAKPSKEVSLILKQTNAERAKEKLPALKLEARLMEAAQKHAEHMAREKSMQHELDGKGPGDRARKAGYRFSRLGENIAMGMDAGDVVGVWMKSKGHRENILGKEYTQIGIGIARDADGAPYYVQVFGSPLQIERE